MILDDENAWARTGTELGGSAPRIRYLHEWGGNGHHLAEPDRAALSASDPRLRWPFPGNTSRRISERPIAIMSCSRFTRRGKAGAVTGLFTRHTRCRTAVREPLRSLRATRPSPACATAPGRKPDTSRQWNMAVGRRSTCMVAPFSYVSAARADRKREGGSNTTLSAAGRQMNRAITQEGRAAIPESVSQAQRTAKLVAPLRTAPNDS